MKAPAMSWHAEGRVCVVAHTTEVPSDAEWSAYLEAMRVYPRVRELRVLIYSAGGGPSSTQRQRLQQQVGHRTPPVAILTTTATPMHGIGTALRWFNGQVGMFEEHQREAAYAHLGLSPFESASAGMCLARLRRQLGLEKRAALG